MQRGVVVRAFIASPGDVRDERDEACSVIAEWNAANSFEKGCIIEPVRMETHSRLAQGSHPQDIINGQLLERCDFLVGVFWSRIGQKTNSADSGSIQEIDEFIERNGGERVLLFFSKRDLPHDHDERQLKALKSFKDRLHPLGLYRDFKDSSDFARQLRHQIDLVMHHLLALPEASALIGALETPESPLSNLAITLLLYASLDKSGQIISYRTRGGLRVSTYGKNFSAEQDPRTEAKWKGALDELDHAGHIEPKSTTREVFRITSTGYAKADEFWHIQILKAIDRLRPNGLISNEEIGEAILPGSASFQSELERHFKNLSELNFVDLTSTLDGEWASITSKGRGYLRPYRDRDFLKLE
jgi:hypothetical protein